MNDQLSHYFHLALHLVLPGQDLQEPERDLLPDVLDGAVALVVGYQRHPHRHRQAQRELVHYLGHYARRRFRRRRLGRRGPPLAGRRRWNLAGDLFS